MPGFDQRPRWVDQVGSCPDESRPLRGGQVADLPCVQAQQPGGGLLAFVVSGREHGKCRDHRYRDLEIPMTVRAVPGSVASTASAIAVACWFGSVGLAVRIGMVCACSGFGYGGTPAYHGLGDQATARAPRG